MMEKDWLSTAFSRRRDWGRLAGLCLVVVLSAAAVSPAGAESPAITDLSNVDIGIIESGDIVEALAVPRATKVRAGARPRVRLPVNFGFGSARLNPEAKQLLRKVSRALATTDLEIFRFSVEGHTDDSGDAQFNANLSKRRAEVVLAFLEQEGIARDRLQSVGRGETNPIESNATAAGRQHNRRVEIINLGSGS